MVAIIVSRSNPHLTRGQVNKLIGIAREEIKGNIALEGLLKPLRSLNIELDKLNEISVPYSSIKKYWGERK
jgi:hypothetical protein